MSPNYNDKESGGKCNPISYRELRMQVITFKSVRACPAHHGLGQQAKRRTVWCREQKPTESQTHRQRHRCTEAVVCGYVARLSYNRRWTSLPDWLQWGTHFKCRGEELVVGRCGSTSISCRPRDVA